MTKRFKIILLIIALVILIPAGIILSPKNTTKVNKELPKNTITETPPVSPTPTITLNEDLDKTDSGIKAGIDQADIDTQNLDQVDLSQDNITF